MIPQAEKKKDKWQEGFKNHIKFSNELSFIQR